MMAEHNPRTRERAEPAMWNHRSPSPGVAVGVGVCEGAEISVEGRVELDGEGGWRRRCPLDVVLAADELREL
jgi:hypothetical protein